MRCEQIKIGDAVIGVNHRPIVIAELSANHLNDMDLAINLVKEASMNGADAIKLQTFRPDTLTIDSDRPEFFINDPNSLWHGRRLWDLYQEAYTPWE